MRELDWETIKILSDAQDHLQDSCNSLDDSWSDAYQAALDILTEAERKLRGGKKRK